MRLVNWILALFAVAHDQSTAHAARALDLSAARVERYVLQFHCYGVRGVASESGNAPREILALCSLAGELAWAA